MSKWLFTFLLGLTFLANAQLVSDNTNAIRIDFSETNEVIKPEKVVLPEIVWEFPTSEYTNSQENQIEIAATIVSKSPIKSLQIKIGKGKEQIRGSKAVPVPNGTLRYQLSQALFLSEGENVIALEVENAEGGVVVDYRNILIGFDAISKAIDINRKDYALLIGTDKYDYWTDLVNPVFDTQTIGQELKDTYGFDTELLQDPTQEELLIKLKEYATKKYRPQDQLLIFIAGHGQFDETFGEGYLVSKGSQVNDAAKTTYIAHSILRNVINNIPCDHILLVMDVCFSGTFDPVIASSRATIYEDIDDNQLLVRKLSKKTRRYLTSGGKEYVSDGIPGQHSPFAQRFLEVLKTKGGGDRVITLTEVYPTMQRLQTLPRTGEFGDNEKDSDFVFVVKQ